MPSRFLVALVAVSLLACAREPSEAEVPEVPATETTITPAQPSTSPPPTDTAIAAAPVKVTLTEYRIDMPVSIPGGSVTFEVTNSGKRDHNFEVEGDDVEKKFDQNLKPGETQSMQIELKPGTYRVYCPVGKHADRGMTLSLTVI